MKKIYLFLALIGALWIGCNLEKIEESGPTTPKKVTFLKNTPIEKPYNSSNAASPFYSSLVDFPNGAFFRYVRVSPNPGTIQVFRWDSLGNVVNGYPLSTIKNEIKDSFAFSNAKSNGSLYWRTRPFCKGVGVSDSCQTWGVSLCSNNGGALIRVNESDLITLRYPDYGQFNGDTPYDGVNIRVMDDGLVTILDHLGQTKAVTGQSELRYAGCDLLVAKYDENLILKNINKVNINADDLSWAIWETAQQYIVQGMGPSPNAPCLSWGGVETHYLNKATYALEKTVKEADFREVDQETKRLNDGSKAQLSIDGDPQVSTRLKITQFNADGATVKNGFPIFISPPAGYATIAWGDAIRVGNDYHIISLVKINPNSANNDICLIKVSQTGQILDMDIYDSNDGITQALRQNVAFWPMSDKGYLIQAIAPEAGILTMMRVDKDGNL
jgi:hypothetical protein